MTPLAPKSFTRDRVLLVEGDTPLKFFEAVLKHLRLSDAIDVRNFGGVNDFRRFLRTLAVASEFRQNVKSVGVIRDAEHNAADALTSVRNAVRDAGLADVVTWKYFILPDNSSTGTIETLCWSSVPKGGVRDCVESFVSCCSRCGVELPADHTGHKAVVQAYLATRKPIQIKPGTAAQAGLWDWTAEEFAPVINFVSEL